MGGFKFKHTDKKSNEDAALTVDGEGCVHNHYKLEITKYISILLFSRGPNMIDFVAFFVWYYF